jgi:NADH:ubiquinone reductase (H+-translocating)
LPIEPHQSDVIAEPPKHYDVLILGAGYAGMMAALRLAGRREVRTIALVNERDFFVERVRLQESLSAPLLPPLRPLPEWFGFTRIEFICATVVRLDAGARTVEVKAGAVTTMLEFNQCIYALGSRTDVAATGAAAHAYRLDPGDGPRSASALRRKLVALDGEQKRVVVVGGGNTAVEAAAQIRIGYPTLDVTLVANGRVGDFGKGKKVERRTREQLSKIGVRIVDDRHVIEVRQGTIITERGAPIGADICVWAAGMRCSAIPREGGVTVDDTNRIFVGPTLRSVSHPHILAIGDAARPVAPTGAAYRPSAFAALTSAAYASASVVNELRGKALRPFSFSAYGQGVAIGNGGVGFLSFPNDGIGRLVVTGPGAMKIRNFFVRLLVWLLRLERLRLGGARFWIGRARVSWRDAHAAVQRWKLDRAAAGS